MQLPGVRRVWVRANERGILETLAKIPTEISSRPLKGSGGTNGAPGHEPAETAVPIKTSPTSAQFGLLDGKRPRNPSCSRERTPLKMAGCGARKRFGASSRDLRRAG